MLGCLIEKQRTTPDLYPLSLNALRLACNQATNRDPVVEYDEATIRAALDGSSRRGWARLASGPGSRVAKYRHLLDDALAASRPDRAARGADAARPADAGRAEAADRAPLPVPSLEDVRGARRAWPSAELVERLPRRPGRSRIATCSCSAAARPAARKRRSVRQAVQSVESTQSPLEQRVARLEEQVAELQRRLDERRSRSTSDCGSCSSCSARGTRSLGVLGERRARDRSSSRSGCRVGPLDRPRASRRLRDPPRLAVELVLFGAAGAALAAAGHVLAAAVFLAAVALSEVLMLAWRQRDIA